MSVLKSYLREFAMMDGFKVDSRHNAMLGLKKYLNVRSKEAPQTRWKQERA
jgi:hypothetical protein